MTHTTHLGYRTPAEEEKARKAAGVFHSIASRYDVMNDLMSGGLRRRWKAFAVAQAGPGGEAWLADINASMLRIGRDRLLNGDLSTPVALCDAEKLPFPDNYFDRVAVAFGLRNMTHRDVAFAEMRRVLKPGDKLLVLEFSKAWKSLQKPFGVYASSVLPWLGLRVGWPSMSRSRAAGVESR